jgi:hypothetical protein
LGLPVLPRKANAQLADPRIGQLFLGGALNPAAG